MTFTKDDLKNLKTQISERCMHVSYMIADEQVLKDMRVFDARRYHMNRINACKDVLEVREYFLSVFKGRTYFDHFIDVVEKEYPQYEYMLDKMLVLK